MLADISWHGQHCCISSQPYMASLSHINETNYVVRTRAKTISNVSRPRNNHAFPKRYTHQSKTYTHLISNMFQQFWWGSY